MIIKRDVVWPNSPRDPNGSVTSPRDPASGLPTGRVTANAEGTIKAVDIRARTVIVVSERGEPVTITVPAGATVMIDGSEAAFERLEGLVGVRVGMALSVEPRLVDKILGENPRLLYAIKEPQTV